MRTLTLLSLIVIVTTACNKRFSLQGSGFTANVRIVTPSTGTVNGKLYLSKRRWRVDLGPISEVFDANQGKGWRTLEDSKQYTNIGWKDVSTYMPPVANGSPCSRAEPPSACKLVGKATSNGRATTKWEFWNQQGEHFYLETDDEAEIAVRWQVQNVTYEATDVRAAVVAESLFELPSDYTRMVR